MPLHGREKSPYLRMRPGGREPEGRRVVVQVLSCTPERKRGGVLGGDAGAIAHSLHHLPDAGVSRHVGQLCDPLIHLAGGARRSRKAPGVREDVMYLPGHGSCDSQRNRTGDPAEWRWVTMAERVVCLIISARSSAKQAPSGATRIVAPLPNEPCRPTVHRMVP